MAAKRILNFFENNKHYVILLIILVAIQINFFSSLPGSTPMGPGWPIIPTLYHFFIFFTLSFLILVYVGSHRKVTLHQIFFSVLISVIFAIVDELDQLFIPLRFAGIKDVLVDSAGILLSVFVYKYLKTKKDKVVTTKKC